MRVKGRRAEQDVSTHPLYSLAARSLPASSPPWARREPGAQIKDKKKVEGKRGGQERKWTGKQEIRSCAHVRPPVFYKYHVYHSCLLLKEYSGVFSIHPLFTTSVVCVWIPVTRILFKSFPVPKKVQKTCLLQRHFYFLLKRKAKGSCWGSQVHEVEGVRYMRLELRITSILTSEIQCGEKKHGHACLSVWQ